MTPDEIMAEVQRRAHARLPEVLNGCLGWMKRRHRKADRLGCRCEACRAAIQIGSVKIYRHRLRKALDADLQVIIRDDIGRPVVGNCAARITKSTVSSELDRVEMCLLPRVRACYNRACSSDEIFPEGWDASAFLPAEAG